MKIKFYLFSLLLPFLFEEPIFANQEDVNAILKEISLNYQRIKAIEAEFGMGITKDDDYFYFKGKYISVQSGKYKLEFRPTGDLIVITSNGEKSFLYIKKINKVFIYENEGNPLFDRSTINSPNLAGKNIISENFDVKFLRKEKFGWGEIYVYQAVPEMTQKLISKILIWIEPKIKVIKKVEVYDFHNNITQLITFDKYRLFNENIWFPLETITWNKYEKNVIKTSVRFDKININGTIKEDIFNFVIPEKAKVEYIKPDIFK